MKTVGQDVELVEGEEGGSTSLAKIDASSLAILNRSEIEQQVSTAKMYPRSIKRFRDEAMEMVTLTEKIAAECIYAVPRGGKMIEGPSARFGEIVTSAWGNCRVGGRVIGVDDENVTAQGIFFDVERNVTRVLEVKRRITDKQGRRYNADMIATTGNAASSVAARNATLSGIPKAFWVDMYDAARKTAIGDVQTLSNKRAEMVAYFQKMGVLPDMICATLEVAGIEDIGLDELAQLKGMASALREGEATPEQLFVMPEKEDKAAGKGTAGLKAKVKEKAEKAKADPAATAADPAKKEPEKKPTEPVKAAGQEQVPFPDPAKTAEPAKTPDKAPEAAKAGAQEAAGSTKENGAGAESGMVSVIAAILRGAKNITELDNAWKREVEGGNLEKIDKKKLAYVYQEVNVKLRNG
jgi:hypothetical protein